MLKNKKILIIALVGLAVVVAGVVLADRAKNDSGDQTGICKTINNKELCTGRYVGLDEADAAAKAEADGITSRVVASDVDKNIAITDDLQPRRVNFTVADGKVTKAEFY